MDQILHKKLINEKNHLQLQVAKANKEFGRLMETVQQYEAILTSLNEAEVKEVKIPDKIRLRGTDKKRPKTFSEATLLRGMEAIKLRAQKEKKLPTAKEAEAALADIRIENELQKSGLGKLTKTVKRIDEVLDNKIDRTATSNIAKHSLKQVQDEKKMLSHMPSVTPARMTLLAQQAKNRESLLNRLGNKETVQEAFKDFMKDIGSQMKGIGADAIQNIKKDATTVANKLSPANIKAGVKSLPGKIEAAAQKMPTQQQNINFVKNNVVPMVGRVATEMNRSAPKNVQKRNASIGRILKP